MPNRTKKLRFLLLTMNYAEKYLLVKKELDRIELLDSIALQQLPRECFESPEVITKTFNDYMLATQENEEAFEEVLNGSPELEELHFKFCEDSGVEYCICFVGKKTELTELDEIPF